MAPEADRAPPAWARALASPRGLCLVVLAGWLAGVAVAYRLWWPGREYPLASAVPGLERLPAAFGLGCLALMAGAAAWAQASPKARWPLGVLAAAAALCVLQDQTRLQPWFYEYVALMLLLGAGGERALPAARLLVVAVYFWSGAHKLNFGFADQVAPWLFSPLSRHAPALAALARPVGFAAPWVEMGLGLGLLWPRTRRVAVAGAVGMHALLLAALGPWALDWNGVVWPWNAAMALLTGALFWGASGPARDILWDRAWRPHRVALVLFGLCPALSFWGGWDDDLSFSLYGGNPLFGDLTVTAAVRDRLPPAAARVARRLPDGRYRLLLDEWAHEDLRVPAYPAARAHRRVAAALCPLGGGDGLELTLRRPAGPFYSAGESTVVSGAELCAAR